jgi:protease-4
MWQKFSKTFKSSIGVISVVTLIVVWSAISYFGISYGKELFSTNGEDYTDVSATETSSQNPDCNVYGINIHGDIVTYNSHDAFNDQGALQYDQTSADEVTYYLKQAEDSDNIKAIAIEIDSSGGSGEAGEEIMQALKQSSKPTVAFIRNRGLSAGYLLATGAQTIFASKFSDVGSIGVTQSYLQNTNKNIKDGYTYIDLSSGKYKDTGSPDRPITEDEKQMIMRDIKIGLDYFIQIVATNRNLDIEKVKKLADGSTVMGEAALKNGLVDKIGLLPDVENFLTEKIGAKAEICWQN